MLFDKGIQLAAYVRGWVGSQIQGQNDPRPIHQRQIHPLSMSVTTTTPEPLTFPLISFLPTPSTVTPEQPPSST